VRNFTRYNRQTAYAIRLRRTGGKVGGEAKKKKKRNSLKPAIPSDRRALETKAFVHASPPIQEP
jgi:hypothetical protein